MFDKTIHIKKLSSGLTCYVIPKKDYVEKQAAFSADFGSADLRYRTGEETVALPQGTAHFLEHKLFEEKDMNVNDAFAQRGAMVNAYTNFSNTSYYFTTGENFKDCLRLLLKFVQTPYFTDENVEKEKGIITQEINMYRDDPHWKRYINLHQALFHENPVRFDITGTEKALNSINKDILYKSYKHFYTPQNMTLVCAGDLDAKEIFDAAEAETEEIPMQSVTRFYGDEPPRVLKSYTEENMPVSIPMFQIGYKDEGDKDGETTAASRLLTDILAGESSPLYGELYDLGFIDNQFSAAYIGGTFYGTSLFAGCGLEPLRVEERLAAETRRLKAEGIPAERFKIIKEKHIGRYMRGLNKLENLVSSQVELHTKKLDVFSMLEILERIKLSDVEERLHNHLRDDNRALSVIQPIAIY